MNTQSNQKPKLRIKAQHIGPIMSLDGELSDKSQNLIFARNGTGKSFLARSLRLLDENGLHGVPIEEIPERLVSEEAANRQGTFSLWEGGVCIGGLGLNGVARIVSYTQPKYIFHVFSEDYVDANLRQRQFEPDGEISHEIIVGKENLELDAQEQTRQLKQAELDREFNAMANRFQDQRQRLQNDLAINAGLGKFKTLDPIVYFQPTVFSEPQPATSVSELQSAFDKLKSVPGDLARPQAFEPGELGVNITDIKQALTKETSPSAVAEEVKDRIARNPNFFQSGIALATFEQDSCPFCRQDLASAAQAAIAQYVAYFEDAEAKAKESIAQLQAQLASAEAKLTTWRTTWLESKTDFDVMKAYFPSTQDKHLDDIEPIFKVLAEGLAALKGKLDDKSGNLRAEVEMPAFDPSKEMARLTAASEANTKAIVGVQAIYDNSTIERKELQNRACITFQYEFFSANSKNIERVRALSDDIASLEDKIAELRRTQGDTADARERVATTFSSMLKRFFGEKYAFDAMEFKVLREQKSMARGGDRTLSDGEKSVMAFCYFIAQSHLRVEANEDYAKIFFVIDDPVTSMSFDYIYSMVQSLKLLRITADGQIAFNLSSANPRPKMLILTHNNYFYNVASSNKAVSPSGLFQLIPGTTSHALTSQKGFATPHQQQLKHVQEVAQQQVNPDYMTPNCIRSVVEGMWKFCRPDLNDFAHFLSFLIDECELEIKSVLLHDLSHGGKFEDPPHKAEDIIEAAQDALKVVQHFAPGQLCT